MKLLTFSGKKQGGKTTAVNDISNRLDCSHDIINFAGYLKEIVLNCFGEPTKSGINLYAVNVLGNHDYEKNGVLPCGNTARELLQWLGTDIMRAKDPDCWVKAYTARVVSSFQSDFPPDIILTGDVRFPNEVKCVQDLGGHVIRLLRNPHNDQHESETALDGMERRTLALEKLPYPDIQPPSQMIFFDAVIDNREMSVEEQSEEIWKLVNERGWL